MTRYPTLLSLGACLVLGSPVAVHGQVSVSASGLGAVAQYRSNATGVVERSSGPMGGLQAHAVATRRMEIDLTLLGGTLSPRNLLADDRRVAELAGRASLMAKPWLALQLGGFTRTHGTVLARERWSALQLGAEARLGFAAAPVRAVLGASLMPLVAVTGAAHPNLAFAGATGLEWRASHVTAAFTYRVERYDFPRAGTLKRAEQFSTLTARLGWLIGASPRGRG